MNAITYQVAMNMGTLTLEDIKEQVYLAQKDLRSQDMIQYYKILYSNHVPLDQNLEFSVHLSSSFEYSFQINAIYPLIKNFILKGNRVYEQMMGLWLLLFYRLKERCFNFAAGRTANSPLIPYVTSFNTETLHLLEQILDQYEWDDELQESIRTSVNDSAKYSKIWTTYYKLRILICDMWLKAVQYDYFYRESRGTGQYNVNVERDVFGVAKTTITERQTDPVDSLEIHPYCKKCSETVVIERRADYAKRLNDKEPDYPTAINTWEGYRIEYEKLHNFFEQFGIAIFCPFNVSYEINPDFLEEYYEKLMPLRQIYHMDDLTSGIASDDHMASLFIKSDMDIKMQREEIGPFLKTSVGFFVAWLVAFIGFAVITDEILHLNMSEFMSRSIIVISFLILIVGEKRIGKDTKRDDKMREEYFEKRRKKQMDYMKMLFSGTLPLL